MVNSFQNNYSWKSRSTCRVYRREQERESRHDVVCTCRVLLDGKQCVWETVCDFMSASAFHARKVLTVVLRLSFPLQCVGEAVGASFFLRRVDVVQ